MVRITKNQLFCLIVLYEIGSTTLFALGIEAKQDAWLVVLASMFSGFFWLWIYLYLQKHFPNKNLVEIIISLIGKPFGIPLCILFGIQFLKDGMNNFTEFGYLINMTFLEDTPLIIIYIMFMIAIIYILFLGIDVAGRTSELLLPVLLFFILSIYFLIIASGVFDISNLTPVLGNGITSGHLYEFLHLNTFPFGEMNVFLMYWCYVDDQNIISKTSFKAVVLSGVVLTISLIVIISVLGVEFASSATIPLLEVVKLINLGDIVTNLDSIGVIIMFIGGFFKSLLRFYGGVLVFATLLKVNPKKLLIPLGLVFIVYSHTFMTSFMFHRDYGYKIETVYLLPTYEFAIPVLLFIICWLKRKQYPYRSLS